MSAISILRRRPYAILFWRRFRVRPHLRNFSPTPRWQRDRPPNNTG